MRPTEQAHKAGAVLTCNHPAVDSKSILLTPGYCCTALPPWPNLGFKPCRSLTRTAAFPLKSCRLKHNGRGPLTAVPTRLCVITMIWSRSCILLLCVLSVLSGAAWGADKDVTSLQIGVKHKPAVCEQKTKKGDSVKVHYTGKLTNGDVFDSSVTRGDPFSFTLGRGMVIKGWDQGLLGMCVGEKRKLKIPSHLAYGQSGSPPKIPGGATLIFETELLGID